MCVEEYVEATGVEGLVELSRYPTRLNPTIADEKTASLPEETETFQNAGCETLEVSTTLCERNCIKMGNLWRHQCAKAHNVRDYRDD
jgi:hypothetical protein